MSSVSHTKPASLLLRTAAAAPPPTAPCLVQRPPLVSRIASQFPQSDTDPHCAAGKRDAGPRCPIPAAAVMAANPPLCLGPGPTGAQVHFPLPYVGEQICLSRDGVQLDLRGPALRTRGNK